MAVFSALNANSGTNYKITYTPMPSNLVTGAALNSIIKGGGHNSTATFNSNVEKVVFDYYTEENLEIIKNVVFMLKNRVYFLNFAKIYKNSIFILLRFCCIF